MDFLTLYVVASLIVAVVATIDLMLPSLKLLKQEHYPLGITAVRVIYIFTFFVLSLLVSPLMLWVIMSKKRIRSFITAFNLTINSDSK